MSIVLDTVGDIHRENGMKGNYPKLLLNDWIFYFTQ